MEGLPEPVPPGGVDGDCGVVPVDGPGVVGPRLGVGNVGVGKGGLTGAGGSPSKSFTAMNSAIAEIASTSAKDATSAPRPAAESADGRGSGQPRQRPGPPR